MDKKEVARVCLAVHPEAEIRWGKGILEKDPVFALSVAAKHAIAIDMPKDAPEYLALRDMLIGTHLMEVHQAVAGRKEAEEAAKLEAIRASIRRKKAGIRKGRPGDHSLTSEEAAVEALDSTSK